MLNVISRRFVTYYRVSTDRQGRSGLGLEAQRRAVVDFISGDVGEVVTEFTEVESGRRADRPELGRAMTACRVHRATLLVAKLDRLARNAHFLLGLKETGIDFLCCDMPAANRLTVGIMAMVAEEEGRMISRRTKAALESAKARGVRLGSPANLTPAGRRKGTQRAAEARVEDSRRYATLLTPTLDEIRAGGAISLRDMAAALNERGIPARRGGMWGPTQVMRVLMQSIV